VERMRQVEELGSRLAYSAYQQMLAQADTMIAYRPEHVRKREKTNYRQMIKDRTMKHRWRVQLARQKARESKEGRRGEDTAVQRRVDESEAARPQTPPSGVYDSY